MPTRREFLMMSAGAGLLLAVPVFTRNGIQYEQTAPAITLIFGSLNRSVQAPFVTMLNSCLSIDKKK
ncbi:hypothetical protein QVN60_17165 [Yersinia aleksiciae]|uniref:hypothetical protein n=1 Tax=Yersinia aleksiciae TaxID=263819 RepID=UPI0011A670BB|nr:hypothetical protein [Yersinia aleksiciae]MDN0124886.1 hypothetical protein [Yersinia aleksiciae]